MKRWALALVLLMLLPAFSSASPQQPSPVSGAPPAASQGEGRSTALLDINYSDVMLLINNQSAMSIQVGNYFKLKRSIPDQNVCNISMPASEGISPAQFQTVRTNVERWINGSGLNDSLNYIVTTKGCPLTVWGGGNTYASFMDELSLILGPYAGRIGNNYWMNNPYFDSQQRFSRKAFGNFLVTRLDGYDLSDCKRLVDSALVSTGARGRFVLDSQPWKDGGGYQSGNDWCRQANKTLVKRGYDVYFDDTPYYVINQKNVSGYCSWGSNDGNSPNASAMTMFTWVPGAIGSTYVSTSARTFAYPPSYPQSMIADNVREGITGIHGNVAEPYLTACARPNIFLDRYTRGWNLAESLAASMATESWENCIIGDPKIEPYANQPDPAIFPADINISAQTVIEGMTPVINATVHNLGGGPAENTTVGFYDGDPEAGGVRIGPNATIPLIPAGGEFMVQMVWNTTRLQNVHNIFVALNATNATQQLWEGNDEAYVSVPVNQRPEVVLAPDRFTVSDLSPLEGDTVNFNFNSKNDGGYIAVTTVDLLIDGAKVQSKNISLLGGMDQNDRFSWSTRGRPGPHSVVISAAPVPYEPNLTNNRLTADLFVRKYGLSMSSDAVALGCLPGLSASFNLTLNSSSNTPESVSIMLSAVPQFWTASVEPSSAVILPNSSVSCRVLVFAPPFATVQDRCELTVTCAGASSKLSLQLGLNVTIMAVRALELRCDPSEGSAIPGENATFKLDVKNLGNGPDNVDLSYDAPPGWAVELESTHLEMPYQGFSSLLLKASPSMSTIAGKKGRVTINATSAGQKTFTASVTVEAEQYFGVEASTPTAQLTLRPGDSADLSISISNKGNGADSFDLVLPRTELAIEALAPAMALDPFTSQNMSISIGVPEGYKSSNERLLLMVGSPGAGRVSVQLDVKVVRPDISLSRTGVLVSPASPVDGARVNVSVTVRNSGAAASGPVTIRLTDGGRPVSALSTPELGPGENVTVTFLWNATAGSHDLLITAESLYPDAKPGDESVPITVVVAPKRVQRPPPVTTGGMPVPFLAAGILTTVAAVGAVAYLMMRRRTGGEQ